MKKNHHHKLLDIKYLFIIILLLVFTGEIFPAEQINKIDSLEIVLATQDSTKYTPEIYIDMLLELAHLYSTNKPLKTIELAKQALSKASNLNNSSLVAECYKFIGIGYFYQGNIELAIENHLNALKNSESIEYKSGIGDAYNGLGIAYEKLKDFPTALLYLQKSLEVREAIKDSNKIVQSLHNIGLIYSSLKDFKTALQYYKRTLEFDRKINNQYGIIISLINIGTQYYNMGDFIEAKTHFLEALLLCEQENDDFNKSIAILNLGIVEQILGNNKKALEYYQIADSLAIKLQSITVKIHVKQKFSELYENAENYKLALSYYKSYKELNDSMINETTKGQIYEMKERFESESKDKQIEIQNITISQKNRIVKILIVFAVIISIMLAIGIIQYYEKSQAYKALVNKNLELTQASNPMSSTIMEQSDSINSEEDILRYKQLETFMKAEKPFLNSVLTIDQLAAMLQTNRTYLSRIIKNNTGSNFNAYINKYRVNESLKLLSDSHFDNFSIEGIATHVGFGSKSTFNSLFKASTGLTPSFYRKNAAAKIKHDTAIN